MVSHGLMPNPWCDQNRNRLVIAFIAMSTIVFLLIRRPVKTLVVVGALVAVAVTGIDVYTVVMRG